MSGRWFRLYADAMRNPKVAKLTDWEFRWWVNLLSVAAENDGVIPPAEDVKHILKVRLDHAYRALNALITAGLIDALDGHYVPHNWKQRQYKSDTSTARVKKHREKRNVSETAPDTETDTETEKKDAAEAAADFVFSGKVIRLKGDDFERWQSSFRRLDLPAELQSRDDWLASEADDRTRRKWFISTSNWLAQKNRAALQVAGDEFRL